MTAVDDIAAAVQYTRTIFRAQGVFGWAYRGDVAATIRDLHKLPTDTVRAVSAAGALLASLADEELARRTDRTDT